MHSEPLPAHILTEAATPNPSAIGKPEYHNPANDTFFVEKVRDIVGLYFIPPDKAVVLRVDDKTQIEALDRIKPLLLKKLGYVEGVTDDYIRHGTSTLYAALSAATISLIAECKPRHRVQEGLSFLRRDVKEAMPEFDVHLVDGTTALASTPKSSPGWRSGHGLMTTTRCPALRCLTRRANGFRLSPLERLGMAAS